MKNLSFIVHFGSSLLLPIYLRTRFPLKCSVQLVPCSLLLVLSDEIATMPSLRWISRKPGPNKLSMAITKFKRSTRIRKEFQKALPKDHQLDPFPWSFHPPPPPPPPLKFTVECNKKKEKKFQHSFFLSLLYEQIEPNWNEVLSLMNSHRV